MKVFISQPMGGLSEAQIRENREKAEVDIRKKYGNDVEIIDSFFEDYCPSKGHIALKFLAKSLELLGDADLAYFCDGYDKARGCCIEWICAIQYGIRVDYETNPNRNLNDIIVGHYDINHNPNRNPITTPLIHNSPALRKI